MRRLLLPAVAAILVAACGGGEEAAPEDPSTTVEASTTSTTAARTTTAVVVDPAVIPTEVTIEYAQAVMDALVHMEGEILRFAVAGENPEGIVAIRDAIYEEAQGAFRARVLEDERAAGFVGIAGVPGDRIVTVTRIIAPGPDCVGLEVESDFRPVSQELGQVASSVVELTIDPDPPEDGPFANPTPYVLDDERPIDPSLEVLVPCRERSGLFSLLLRRSGCRRERALCKSRTAAASAGSDRSSLTANSVATRRR